MAKKLHTYVVQEWTMQIGNPIRFSDGEKVIAVLDTKPVPLSSREIRITFLLEIPDA